MKISVIMPVYLGEYEGCAADRKKKFIRAVDSFVDNRYNESELIIVSDGCEETVHTYKEYGGYWNRLKKRKDINVRLVTIDKMPLFSGKVRWAGIEQAEGEVICYLDSDDIIGSRHLQNIYDEITEYKYDWAFFDDSIQLENNQGIRISAIEHGRIGTSNLCHRKEIENGYQQGWYNCNGYGHDWKFVNKLIESSSNYGKIHGASYIVMHLPNMVDN